MLPKCPNCGHKFERDLLTFDEEDPVVKSVKKHMENCTNKFRDENPCPKCGSHNVDIDLGTPIWCNNCGWEWEG